jgi:hypothetical protein
MSKKLITAVAAATLGAAAMTAPVVHADTEASFSASNMYLWRAMDQGGGGHVAGDVTYTNSGFTASVWTGSTGGGEEIDLTASYSNEFKDLSYEVGVIKYQFPEAAGSTWHDSGNNDETFLNLGYKDFSFSFFMNNNDGDETYTALSYTRDKYTATLGWVDFGDPLEGAGGGLGQLAAATVDDVYTHLDVTYAVNDNFSFTASQIINRASGLDDSDAVIASDGTTVVVPAGRDIDNDLHLVVTYSMPIEL